MDAITTSYHIIVKISAKSTSWSIIRKTRKCSLLTLKKTAYIENTGEFMNKLLE